MAVAAGSNKGIDILYRGPRRFLSMQTKPKEEGEYLGPISHVPKLRIMRKFKETQKHVQKKISEKSRLGKCGSSH